jgi:hypothetical protein
VHFELLEMGILRIKVIMQFVSLKSNLKEEVCAIKVGRMSRSKSSEEQ